MKVISLTLAAVVSLASCSEDDDSTNSTVEQAAQIIIDEHQEKKERRDELESKLKTQRIKLEFESKTQRIELALNKYLLDNALVSPNDDFDLDTLLLSANDGGGYGGPYLEADDLIDPWGNAYFIVAPGESSSFDVLSNHDFE